MINASEANNDIRPLTPREFEQIRTLAYEKFGLSLREGKETLVSARLGKKIRELNFNSFQQYYQHVVGDSSGEALVALIDALTTNHTSFFREPIHFEFLREKVLPQVRDRERIAIWSAACSTGEEPYSIAACIQEEWGEAGLSRLRILATDISTRALKKAQNAVYPAERFEGIPVQQLRPFLLRGNGESRGLYRVKPQVRGAVEFARVNLMESLSHLGPFSVIFCRNVMIYFDKPTQEGLVNRLAGCLEPGGYLFTGHSESLNGIKHPLKFVRAAIYRKASPNEMETPRGLKK